MAELEAKVASLTKLLEAQGLQDSTSPEDADTADTPATSTGSGLDKGAGKKRKLEATSRAEPDIDEEPRHLLDHLVTTEQQQKVVDNYVQELVPRLPIVPVRGDYSVKALRSKSPTLFGAIIYAGSQGVLDLDTQEEIAKVFLDELTSKTIAAGEKSLELIQAIQISSIWYRSPKHHKFVAAFQLIQMATSVATDIWLGEPILGEPGSGNLTTSYLRSQHYTDFEPADGWRAWLVCYMTSASMAIFMRRPNEQKWTQHHNDCLFMLEYSPHALPTDRLLCQYIRAEHLCDQIASQLHFGDYTVCHDVSEPVTKFLMQDLQNKITDWKSPIPMTLRRPSLTFWEHATTIYLHEPLLHTLTNKQTFSAPFLAERLSMTDFPAPMVTKEHVASIYALKDACYQLVDLYTGLKAMEAISLPGMLFAARVVYAVYMLMKLYIATSAIGNTYGAVLDRNDIKVGEYLDRVAECGIRLQRIDQRAGATRVLGAAERMKEWLTNYNATLQGKELDNVADIGVPLSEPYSLVQNDELGIDWNAFNTASDSFNAGQYDFDNLSQPIPHGWPSGNGPQPYP